jgi:hypothetical protein
MTIHIPTWLVETAYILGVVGLVALAGLGLLFVLFFMRFDL